MNFKKLFSYLFFPTLLSNNLYALDKVSDNINTELYGSFECGMTNNRALYATSGYERQILTCTEAVIGLKGYVSHNSNLSNNTSFVFEFAPIYNSIKMDSYEQIKKFTYENIDSPATGKNIPIYSGSEYVSWYKNQGSRMYYLEDYPVREMYLGVSFFDNNLKFSLGRMRNLLSFDERDMIWQEDAWFAPIAFWISKDLYTGIKIGVKLFDNLNLNAAMYSGDGNPTKNWFYYMNNVGSPNKKSNNTPTVSFQVKYDINFFEKLDNSVFFGLERGTQGSTWTDIKNEGKHNKNILVLGFDSKYIFNNDLLKSAKFYLQYTRFISGLRERQTYVNSSLVKDITQKGIFFGFDINLKNKFVFGFTYEIFDRYDYMAHVYSYGGNKGKEPNKEDDLGSLDKYKDSKQQSFIINIKYFINKNIYLNFAANFIDDPLNWVSEILPEKGSNRYKLTLNVRF